MGLQLIYNMIDAEWVVWSNDINEFKAGKTTTKWTTVGGAPVPVYEDETVGEKYMSLSKDCCYSADQG